MPTVPDRSRGAHLPPSWKATTPRSLAGAPVSPGRRASDYEFCILTIPQGASMGEARQALTDEAEYGRWELARSQKFLGGGRKVWLRRRVMRLTAP